MEGINGEFVSRPSQQDKDGEWYDTVYCTKEISEKLLKMVKAEQGKAPEPEFNQSTDDDENIPF